MRKHRLFGVVIATSLGTGLIVQQPGTTTHHLSTIDLASSGTPLGPSPLGQLSGSTPQTGDAMVALSSLLAPPPPPPPKPAPKPAPTTTTTVAPTTTTTVAPTTTTTVEPTTIATVPPTTAAPAQTVAPATAASSSYTPTSGDWLRLRECESGDNYAENTGNGFFGAYQFSEQTWQSLGYSGLPSNASPAVQDQAAQRLQAQSGWGQWPQCSRELGL